MAGEAALNSTFVTEPARPLPVSAAYEVVVAGGGIAGVAAAVAAARQGVSVGLLERSCALGGLATLGNVIVWLPLCDGTGRQVTGGLAEELLKLAVEELQRDNRSARFCGIPPCWRPGGDPEERRKVRYRVEFNPAAYLLALEQLAVDAGVDLLYDTRVCAAQREDRAIRHLIVENKSGRSAIACRTVVDASGDADICWLAGEQIEALDSNVLCGWFYTLNGSELKLHALSNHYSPYATKSDAAGPFFRGDDARQVTAHILGTRQLIRQRLAQLRAEAPAADIQVVSLPTIPCLRMTRRLVGAYSLGQGDVHRWFDDAVGLTGDWRRRGPVYAVPLRSLCGVQMRNLLAAGRCISADTTVWDVTRAIPTCAMTGEAAGTAAALAVRQNSGEVRSLSATAVQAQLERQGVLLDPALAAPAEKAS